MVLTSAVFFLFAFATMATIVWCITELFKNQEDPLGDRLVELQSNAMVATVRTTRRPTGGGFVNNMIYVLSLIGLDGWMKETQKELNQAGMRSKQALAVYAFFNLLFLLFLIAGAVYLQRDKAIGDMLIGIMPAFLLGYLIPKQVLHRLVARYRRKLQEALPDTVDLLGIVLGTGLALDQAMTRVSEEMQHIYPELANEFYTVTMQVRAGQERGVAFQQFVRRTGIEDIKSLAAMIIQSEKFGTSLSQALKVYAEAMRTRRRLRAEAAVAKAGIKMLFPIVVFILPVLFVITLVPGMLSVLANLKLLGGAKP
jgi:tight adherence protein C